jgi:phospholipid/cholesterol/gamma-HCH transport system ATP-binding protein
MINIQNISKSFGKNHVLQGLSLKIEKGQSVVVIGGSGTGKSVLLKSVLGLITPDSGKILVGDDNVVEMSESQKDAMMQKFGMLFQGAALFDSLPVWENIAFGLIHGQKTPKKDAKDIAIEKMRAVGLSPDIAERFPAELSGGMQKRVGLARAVATNPEIIFFDEPTTGLDPIMADVINDLIVEQVRGLGATTLTITHDMASARKIATHVAMIYEGKIIWHGTVADLDHSNNDYVDQFIHGRAQGPITNMGAI